ncbi:MAG: radical SAM protein [Cellulosilyticum sp.]|nr:radical SAM protein [Cellulosilyticum sp.]
MGVIKRNIDCHIPITMCNLRCSYCYIAQKEEFYNQKPKVYHTIDEERYAFSQERLGGVCMVNLCAGGETLLYPAIKELVEVILENGHYVMIVTNGLLTEKFKELITIDRDMRKRLFFKFSFHYLELKRLNKFDVYFDNIRRIKEAGCSFTVEMTPCDEEIPYIDDIKEKCIQGVGALPHITIARSDVDPEQRIPHLSKLSFEDYKKVWGQFNSNFFDEKCKMFYQKRTEYCYAGEWSAFIDLEDGRITPCNCGKEIGNFYDFSRPINFCAIGNNCEIAHCYNGHSWLSFGNIPELEFKTYAELRNRVCADGSEWLTPTIKEAFSSKLVEQNKEHSWLQKKITNYKYKKK